VRREDQEIPNPSRSRSFCGEGDVDGGGLTGDNDGGGVKWSRGAPTREVAAAEVGSPLARGGGAAETGYRRGSDRMPGRQRPDAGVGAAGCCGGGGLTTWRRRKQKKKPRAAREHTGKPSRPNESWISSSRKTQGSGLRSSAWWAAKGCTNLAQGRLAQGRLAQGKGRDPAGKLGCQSRP
jgi:hypothetical protein